MPRQNLSSSLQTSQKAKTFLNMSVKAQEFNRAADFREAQAAKIATDVSRFTFDSKLSGRALAPPRVGRATTGGQFASDLLWTKAPGSKDISISFDQTKIEAAAPYWFIQEIGTGQTANVLGTAVRLIVGPSVPTQVGRRISGALVWANGAGGQAVSPQTGVGTDQLYPRGDVNGGFVVKGRTGTIRREIKGKHFIRDGGAQGFRALDSGLRADVKRIFQ